MRLQGHDDEPPAEERAEALVSAPPGQPASPATRVPLRAAILALAAVFFALHFVHLRADFPNDSPWMDWSKYTDEGWYGDAAIRHSLFGHWYLAGDFNPAAALPFWPLLLGVLFHFTGVSLVAARAFTVVVFGVMLWALYRLIERFPVDSGGKRSVLAAPIAVLLLCASPFVFVFSRMAILEPPLAALTALALLAASHLQSTSATPGDRLQRFRALWPAIALGVLLPAMVLTKTTAIALFPAIGFMLWHRAGHKVKQALRLALPPVLLGATIWAAYFFLWVRPHYLEDYEYLFSANGYTGFQLQPLATVLFNTFSDGLWMGAVLYAACFAGFVLALFLRPKIFRNPLVGSLLLWVGGYFAFLAYHNNLQPRYYLVPAVAMTALVAVFADEFRLNWPGAARKGRHLILGISVTAVLLAIVVPDALLELTFVRHPEYTFLDAVQSIASIVRDNPKQSPLILSISGSDITLMTGLPSIDDDFGTLDLDERVQKYHPGWYVAWNQIEDDKMDALTPMYHPVRVASFPAMDDPDRNELILYRLDPAARPGSKQRRQQHTPKPLRTKLGQQPTINQLQH